MSDRRLQVFYTVARLLSFTKAAEELHMTQPAVTFQVRQLEEQLPLIMIRRLCLPPGSPFRACLIRPTVTTPGEDLRRLQPAAGPPLLPTTRRETSSLLPLLKTTRRHTPTMRWEE